MIYQFPPWILLTHLDFAVDSKFRRVIPRSKIPSLARKRRLRLERSFRISLFFQLDIRDLHLQQIARSFLHEDTAIDMTRTSTTNIADAGT